MITLADYRGHVDRIAALPGDAPDAEVDAICIDEANRMDPASNVGLRESISASEWPSWAAEMQRQRHEVIAWERRRRFAVAVSHGERVAQDAVTLARRMMESLR